jgi:hypothetical protein
MHSNFITPPDLIETILIINATDTEILACQQACAEADRAYDVYVYAENLNNTHWFGRVYQRADTILVGPTTDLILGSTTGIPGIMPEIIPFGPGKEISEPVEYFHK